MKQALSAIVILISLSLSLPLYADSIRVPIGHNTSSYSGALPQRGQSKDEVEARFGPANSIYGPKGSPPIYYWEYAKFTVYFESGYVLHAVIKKR